MADEVKEKLNRVRARRRGHRGVCTKLEKEATELLQIPEGEIIKRNRRRNIGHLRRE
jgi:hypothetical protein